MLILAFSIWTPHIYNVNYYFMQIFFCKIWDDHMSPCGDIMLREEIRRFVVKWWRVSQPALCFHARFRHNSQHPTAWLHCSLAHISKGQSVMVLMRQEKLTHQLFIFSKHPPMHEIFLGSHCAAALRPGALITWKGKCSPDELIINLIPIIGVAVSFAPW